MSRALVMKFGSCAFLLLVAGAWSAQGMLGAGPYDDDQYRVYVAFNSGQNDMGYSLQWSAQTVLDAAAPGVAPNASMDALLWPMALQESCQAPATGIPTFVTVRGR